MEQTAFPIKHWAEDDRPREKLMLKGKHILSDAELLAILIGSGSRNESAVQLSKRILAGANNNLNALGKLSLKQLMAFKGIGEAKANHCGCRRIRPRRSAEERKNYHPNPSSKVVSIRRYYWRCSRRILGLISNNSIKSLQINQQGGYRHNGRHPNRFKVLRNNATSIILTTISIGNGSQRGG